MKKKIAILCLLCLVVSITSCFIKESTVVKSETYVGENEVFFETHTFSIPQNIEDYDSFDDIMGGITFYGEDTFITTIMAGHYESGYNYRVNSFYEKYDYNGNFLGKVGLEPNTLLQLVTFYEDGNETYAVFQEVPDSVDYVIYCVDFENRDMSEYRRFSLDVSDGYLITANPVYIGSEILLHTNNWSEHNSAIVALDINGNVAWKKKFDFEVFNVSDFDEDNVLINSVDNHFYKYTISTNSLDEIDIDGQFNSKYVHGTIGSNGNIYKIRPDRIDVLNVNDMTESVFIDFNYCDMDINRLGSCNLGKVTDNKIILNDLAIRPGENARLRKITVLYKVDINPYVGRAIIEVAQLWYVNEVLGAGVYQYNHSQTEYFAYISSRYNTNGDFVVPEIYGDNLTSLQITQLIMDQLKLDILNGDGPDVIIGLGETTVMDDPKYLLNFNEILESDSGFNTDDYFSNAFFAYQNEKGLFQIPLEISGFGILATDGGQSTNGIGFTYNEYISYTNVVNEGFDLIARANDRDAYMLFLYTNNEDAFFENGNANFDCEAFREMAVYLKEMVTPNGLAYDVDIPDGLWWNVASFYEDIQYDEFHRGWEYYGAPSHDGRGPMLSVFNTVAIASSTCSSDASWDFVKTLLSEEIQEKSINNPINLSAFYVYAHNSFDMIDILFEGWGMRNPLNLTEEDIETYRAMLDKIDHSDAIDSEIYIIVCEEMPAYFNDDKTLNQVIEIINRRAQLVLDERG